MRVAIMHAVCMTGKGRGLFQRMLMYWTARHHGHGGESLYGDC